MAGPLSEFGVTQVAEMIGSGRTFVFDAIRAGRLPARRLAVTENGHRKYKIARADLVRWLVSIGFPLDRLRQVLNPGDMLFLVGCDPAVQAALTRVRTVAFDSLFSLGLNVSRRRPWGIVIDLPANGPDQATRDMCAFAKRHDRPELVGLYGPDIQPQKVESVFDVLIPRSLPAPQIARALYLLRPGCRARDLV